MVIWYIFNPGKLSDMLSYYLIIAFRNLHKRKLFTLINVFGLAAGMTACLLIFKYVNFELSYDDFRRPTVYRISEYGFLNGKAIGRRAQTVPALAPALQRDIPEVVRAARLVHTDPLMSGPVMQAGDRSFHEDKIYFADQAFPEMFSYQFVKGNPENALADPNSVIISTSMARKYFPDQEALGQSLTFYQGERGQSQLKITGVFNDIPANSHIHTDFLVSFSSIPWNLDDNWDWGNFYNYIEVLTGTDPEFMKQKVNRVLEKYLGETLAEWKKEGYTRELDLQPLRKIHLDSHLEAEAETNGNHDMVRFLSLIAVFIVIIAWINYLNLTTANSVERAREIGIRKIVGSTRRQLIFQLLAESFMINLLALSMAFLASYYLLPAFRNITQSQFNANFDPILGLSLLGIFLTGTLLSGFYPAFLLSSYKPLQVIKGNVINPRQGLPLQKSLVIFQFSASIALIAGTMAIHRQIKYMQQKDLGMNIDQTLVIKGPGIKDSSYQDHLSYFKEKVNTLNLVRNVSVSSNIPGRELSWARSFYRSGHPDNRHGINIIAIDEDFLQLYETNFLAGRNFSMEHSSDREGIIINETAMRELGFQDPQEAVNQQVVWVESDNDLHTKKIVGVIKDYNQESLHKKAGPIVFVLKRYLNAPWAGEYYSIRMNTDNYPSAVAAIHNKWEEAFPGSPFDYFFLDVFFNNQYRADRQFGTIFSFFAGLAILIACLGLFGLTLFMTLRRTREIGIRKVLGATANHVIALLSGNFIRLILIASILILPVIYYAIKIWLENFAYRMTVSWWLFVLPVLSVWLMALITISIQTVKTAMVNPVKSLRYE